MGLTRQQLTMVTVLMCGAFLVVLNQTLLTPALPTIMANLQVSATTVQWLTSGYALVEAVIIPLNAYFLGRIATRKIFIGGLILFTCGTALCAGAPSFAFLMLGRVMQASATGVVMPMVFTLVLVTIPRENRGVAMGFIGLIISFAPALGPALSGVLVDHIGWRALFVLVASLAVVIVAASAFALKNYEGFERTTFDAPSVALIAVGMVSLLYGISTSTSTPAELIWRPALLILVGIVVVGLFAYRQTRLENPILRVRVLKVRPFAVVVVIIALLEGALIGESVLFPLYLQNAVGVSATLTGLIMLPGAVVGALCALAAGKLFDRYGVRGIAVIGSFILLAGVVGYVFMDDVTPLVVPCVLYTVVGIGIQALITPLNTWGVNALPNVSLPHGNAIISTIEQVGASLGTAFVVSLTALGQMFAAPGAGAQAVAVMGCHAAFVGIVVLIFAICVLIVLFVKDPKPVGR